MSIPTLTTTFIPPSECLSTFYFSTQVVGFALIVGPVDNYSRCFPPGWTEGPSQYFSPGICPSGYVSACSSVNSGTETAVTCCPSGFSCNNPGAFPYYPWYQTYSCTSAFPKNAAGITVQGYKSDSQIGLISFTSAEGGLNAYSVQVRFKAGDFATSTANPTGTTEAPASGASAGGAENTNQPTATVTVLVTPRGSGLSTGAQVAIGIVVAVVALALLFGVYLYMRHARKRRQPAPPEAPAYIGAKPELDSAGARILRNDRPVVAIAGLSRAELDGRSFRPTGNEHELSGASYYETAAPAYQESTSAPKQR